MMKVVYAHEHEDEMDDDGGTTGDEVDGATTGDNLKQKKKQNKETEESLKRSLSTSPRSNRQTKRQANSLLKTPIARKPATFLDEETAGRQETAGAGTGGRQVTSGAAGTGGRQVTSGAAGTGGRQVTGGVQVAGGVQVTGVETIKERAEREANICAGYESDDVFPADLAETRAYEVIEANGL
jgi:hypothetical protein